jgi:uncharacterized protein DUF5996
MNAPAEAAAQSHTGWPPLPLGEWSATLDTLHRWVQIVGKTRLALAAPLNHWWHVTLYTTGWGITTSTMYSGLRPVEVELDFLHHELRIHCGDGLAGSLPLQAQTVAQFFREYTRLLASLGVEVKIRPVPSEMGDELPFPDDQQHRSYDPDHARRCWELLSQATRVFQRFRGRFLGKCSPVHFFWGGFDLACTRFSGRRAPVHPGGIPHLPDWVVREAYSHECISAGWWPGNPGGPVAEPAFYAYAYPEPAGFSEARVLPGPAYYNTELRDFILPYEAVRSAPRPDEMLLEFLQITYEAGADLGGWDRANLERERA